MKLETVNSDGIYFRSSPEGVCVVALGGHAWLLQGGMHGCSGGCAWLLPGGGHAWFFGGACVVFSGGVRRIRRDTVNERAVRILLECILVEVIFSHLSDDDAQLCVICTVRLCK